MIAGNPQSATGCRRGAAVDRGFLDDQHLRAGVRGTQRRRHRAGAGADHEHVDLMIPAGLGHLYFPSSVNATTASPTSSPTAPWPQTGRASVREREVQTV